ncbi:hypothetical protein [Poseidonocella sedimentorum]|uniref:Uncharacterized protein n=1 Tax=Poseidonocella sedimentorum TaxID=871652 RepID=A0A1I6D5K6_9RHOB|nr:hypothetical protein [Poseidonocella sedimentorum]SFR00738.1 hypothetical protein SAMN04515673_102212 [Poseidonocella sedimentorum]
MTLIADILLVGGALGAGLYCFVLSRRLARFNDLETGVGGAVAVLSAQVDDLTNTLTAAQGVASSSSNSLIELTQRADTVARRLELLVASMHDLPDETAKPVETAKPDEPAADAASAEPDVEPEPAAEPEPKTAEIRTLEPAGAAEEAEPAAQEAAVPMFRRGGA